MFYFIYSICSFIVFITFLTWKLVKIFRFFKNKILISLGYVYDFKHPDNAFAIITGSTDGMGLEYAKFFAEKSYRLFLLSRNEEKLNLTKMKIEKQFPQCKEIRILAVDFSKIDIYDQIQNELNKLSRIDVLVNNVGLFYPIPDFFTKLNTQTITNIINVNIIACTRLTHMCLLRMESQNKGLILNISSISCAVPLPLVTVYGATKTYMDYFTCALQYEYTEKKDIIIQSVVPCYVVSKMSRFRHPNLLVPTAKAYVQSQMKTIGLQQRTHGYWTHEIQASIAKNFIKLFGPSFIQKHIFFKSVKLMRDIAYERRNLKID